MQGFNMGRYYPPDSSSTSNTPPKFNSSAAQHRRNGIPIVRFELPFAVWCQTCKPAAIIGQGVRLTPRNAK